MSPDRWERVNQLFDLASSLPPQERDSLLQAEASGDPEILNQVQRLLRSHDEDGGLLDNTLPDVYQMLRTPAQNAVQRTFAAGDLLAGRFLVERFLGRGGMGEVYAAFDRELRENVALKTVRSDIAGDESVVDKFRGEVLRARQIAHPNTCRVYDLFAVQHEGKFVRFLTMELLQGETLDALLKRQAPLVPEEAVELLQQMAAGLEAVHASGLVHRDFKPANVFLVPKGEGGTRVVVTDFGLARRASNYGSGETSRSFAAGVGTPAYMAPEQFLGSDVTPAADVYAFGLVAYEMVTGVKPYPAESASRRLIEAPPPPRVHVADLPSGWNDVLLDCLERDPQKRPTSPSQAIAGLRRSLTGASVDTRANRRRWATAMLIAALLLVSMAGWTYLRRQAAKGEHRGAQQFPALSPDGRQLVYAWGPVGKRDLFLESLPDGVPENLTPSNPGEDSEAAFAPDGKRLAFYSERDKHGLYLLSLDRQVVEFLAAEGHAPAWSPNGDRLVFVQEALEDADNRTLGGSSLYLLNLADRKVTRLNVADALQPAWSPDGKSIAFLQIRGGVRKIYSYRIETGETLPLTSGPGAHWSPAWSPDGRYLYYCSDESGSMNLFRVRVEGLTGRPVGAPEPVKVPGDYIGPLSIARAAEKLAYVEDTSTTTLYRTELEPGNARAGSSERLPVTSSLMLAAELSLSPKGDRLVFATQRSKRDLFAVNTDGTKQVQLTDDADRDIDPVWSPNGDMIAFQSNQGSPSELRRYEIHGMRPDGSARGPLTSTAGITPRSALNPVWSPNGQELAFTLNGVGVFVTQPRLGRVDSAPRRIAAFDQDSNESFIAKSWSPDGKLIAGIRLGRDGAVLGLGLLDVESGVVRSLTSDAGASPAWLPDNRRLAYRKNGGIWLADRATGETQPLPLGDGFRVFSSLAVSRDGRAVVFSHLDRRTSVGLVDLTPSRR